MVMKPACRSDPTLVSSPSPPSLNVKQAPRLLPHLSHLSGCEWTCVCSSCSSHHNNCEDLCLFTAGNITVLVRLATKTQRKYLVRWNQESVLTAAALLDGGCFHSHLCSHLSGSQGGGILSGSRLKKDNIRKKETLLCEWEPKQAAARQLLQAHLIRVGCADGWGRLRGKRLGGHTRFVRSGPPTGGNWRRMEGGG